MIYNFKNFLKVENSICPFCLERYLSNINFKDINESINSNFSSLQISIPLKGCINSCKSCIAKISGDNNISYKDHSNEENFDYKYFDSLKKVKKTGCKNIILTSDKGEPLQNKKFIEKIGDFNRRLDNWFNIEIQTTGVLLYDNISFLKNNGINVISLSIFDIFDDENNFDIITIKNKLKFNLKDLCLEIKKNNITLRLSINLIKSYDNHTINELFQKIKELSPDQVTFKNLWHTEDENPINKWIKTNKASSNILNRISEYIRNKGGNKISDFKYIFDGRSIWMVDNCMLGNYIILRPDAKLYRSWDSPNPLDINI